MKNKVWKMSFVRRSEYDLEFFEATMEVRANRVWLQPLGNRGGLVVIVKASLRLS